MTGARETWPPRDAWLVVAGVGIPEPPQLEAWLADAELRGGDAPWLLADAPAPGEARREAERLIAWLAWTAVAFAAGAAAIVAGIAAARVPGLMQILFLLLAAHAVCDFPLQPAQLAAAKRGGDPSIPWYMALGCHGLIHGGGVALVTGLWWLGAAEAAAHALIDGGKCRDFYGIKTDQALHFACKLAWAVIAVGAFE